MPWVSLGEVPRVPVYTVSVEPRHAWCPGFGTLPGFTSGSKVFPGPLLLSKPAQPVCWLGCFCVKQTVLGKQREDLGAFIRKANALACH